MGQSVLTNTLIASLGRIINVGLGLIVIGLLTRTLGQVQFGVYTFALAFGTILNSLADAGLYLTLTRKIAHEPEREHSYLAHTIGLRLALVISVFAGGYILTLLLPHYLGSPSLFLIMALGFIFQSCSQLLMGVFQKHGLIWRAVAGDIVGRVVQIIGLLFNLMSFSATKALALFTLSAASAFGVHWVSLPERRRVGTGGWYDWTIWQHTLRESWPLGLLLLLNMIYFRSDTLVLSFFRSPAEVGLYGLAYRVVESALFFPAMFGGLLLPRLTVALAQSSQAARFLFQQALRLICVAACGAALATFLLSPSFIVVLAGPNFSEAAALLRILSLALGCMYIGNVLGFTLVAQARQHHMLVLYTCLVVFNITANFLLIPRFGATAAAWTTVITECIAVATAAYLVHQRLPYQLSWSFLLKLTMCVTVSAAGFIFLRPDNFVVQLFLLSLLFIVVVVVTGTLKRSDLSLLLSKT